MVFQEDGDYSRYLEWLKYYSDKYSLKIWAYCLMNNHVHFIAVPLEGDSMARAFNTLHMRYAQYVNIKQSASGHLWQGRYYSCVLDERHLYAAMRYVENNPVRAQVVKKAQSYKWSSANSHVKKINDPVLSKGCHIVNNIKDWGAYLEERDEDLLTQAIKENTRTGRPCGDERFIRKIELTVGRRLVALPRGRPRKGE